MKGHIAVRPEEDDNIQPRYHITARDELLAIQNDAPEEFDLFAWGLLPSGPTALMILAVGVAEEKSKLEVWA